MSDVVDTPAAVPDICDNPAPSFEILPGMEERLVEVLVDLNWISSELANAQYLDLADYTHRMALDVGRLWSHIKPIVKPVDQS